MRISTDSPTSQSVRIRIQGEGSSAFCNPHCLRKQISLDKHWTFRKSSDALAHSLPVAQFPTNIHLDLYHHRIIPDPFHGKNERDLQWVGEESWTYRTTFPTPDDLLRKTLLCFDGLDTYAKIMFNDTEILSNKSMFVPTKIDVTDLLRSPGFENSLSIVFESTWLKGLSIVGKYPDHHWGCSNGHPSRLAVRKAQYQYGWDWGPKFMTCGPWRPVYLDTHHCRMSRLKIGYRLGEALATAHLDISWSLSEDSTYHRAGSCDRTLHVHVALYDPDGSIIEHAVVGYAMGSIHKTFLLASPKLWYPRPYGEQPLYRVVVALASEDGVLKFDQVEQRIGLRKVELVQAEIEDKNGKSFYLRVNDIPIFCGGSCWIPGDSFLPRLGAEDYRQWVRLAAEGRQVMIRVWGGGIYEDDAFYQACDELGVLVWQDFMFACGAYPANDGFLSLVEQEARANVERLMHHPSIVLWAGNNEDYQYQEQNGLEYNHEDKDPEHWLHSSFPARYIYEKLIPDVLHELIEGVIYRFGSPFGGKSSNDQTLGDIHQWNVWHGEQRPYQEWSSLCGRFVSEFGMQALPDVATINSYMCGIEEGEWHAYSSTMDFHNKAFGQVRRMAVYMSENLRFELQPLRMYTYYTQLMQAECLSNAFRAFKRKWVSSGKRECGGALVWQLNDCWPCTSWSVADYFRRPKMAYWAMKRELAPLTISVERIVTDDGLQTGRSDGHHLGLWATNFALKNMDVTLVVKEWEINTGTCLGEHSMSGITLPKNSTKELGRVLPHYAGATRQEADYHLRIVVAAYLYPACANLKIGSHTDLGRCIARYISWPDPLKYVPEQRTSPGLMIRVDCKHETVRLSVSLPLKGVLLSIRTLEEQQRQRIAWADNGFDLVPNENLEVKAPGIGTIGDGDLTVNWYGRAATGEKDGCIRVIVT